MECVVDSREISLLVDLQKQQEQEQEQQHQKIPIKTKMLALGDILIQKQEGGEILMMIERKTVRDLIHSLKDGRYHDQRRRWLEFMKDSPNSSVSLWVEGDLMATEMEETLRSSLLNSLFRLQSKHNILVHHVRSRDAFIKSLWLVMEKFEKDPYHLVPSPTDAVVPNTSLNQYKKSSHSEDTYWQNCLALIPGVSSQAAEKLTQVFPSIISIMEDLKEDPQKVFEKMSGIKISEKRKLGDKSALKILRHLYPTLSFLDQKK